MKYKEKFISFLLLLHPFHLNLILISFFFLPLIPFSLIFITNDVKRFWLFSDFWLHKMSWKKEGKWKGKALRSNWYDYNIESWNNYIPLPIFLYIIKAGKGIFLWPDTNVVFKKGEKYNVNVKIWKVLCGFLNQCCWIQKESCKFDVIYDLTHF